MGDGIPEHHFVQTLKRQIAAIDLGTQSLRGGLVEIVLALMISDVDPDADREGVTLSLARIPDAMIHHWLRQVATGETSLEACLGTIVAEAAVGSIQKLYQVAMKMPLAAEEGAPSSLDVLNVFNQLEANTDILRQQLAGTISDRIAERLRGALDAHTANQLVHVLQQIGRPS